MYVILDVHTLLLSCGNAIAWNETLGASDWTVVVDFGV